jgi:uncharacterized protein with ParB-like and HNH nuclease domain
MFLAPQLKGFHMSQFTFESNVILTILKQNYFSVPIYQRSYSWDEEEYSDFWDDLSKAARNDREYFLGTIVLSQEAEANHVAIIDGQQRLATTTMLLAAIRDLYDASDDLLVKRAAASINEDYLAPFDSTTFTEKQRLRLNPNDNDFYYNYVINNKELASTNSSHKKIADAKRFFTKRLQAVKAENPTSWQQLVSKLHSFLQQKALIVVVRASSNQEAFTIFETLNDRGADLTIADLLKNYLFSTSAHEIAHVQQKWVEAGSQLNIAENHKRFIDFLRHLWSSMHGKIRERDLYRSIRENIQDHSSAVRFSNEILDGAQIYQAILSGDSDYWVDKSAQACQHAKILMLLDLEQNRPLLLAMLQHFRPRELEKALGALVAWSVRGIVVGGIGGGQAEKVYCDAATAIRRGAIKNREDLLLSLDRIIPSDSHFNNALVYEKVPKPIIVRYMLQEIERHLRGPSEPELIANPDKEEVNLEHILPLNATANDWPQFAADDVPLYANRLGNMTLLKKSENNKVGNKMWAIKRVTLARSTLNLNSSIKELPDWTTTVIDQRSRELSLMALEIWRR